MRGWDKRGLLRYKGPSLKPGGRAGSKWAPRSGFIKHSRGKSTKSGRALENVYPIRWYSLIFCVQVCHRLSSTVSTLPPVWFTHSVPLSLRRALSHGPVPTSAVSRGHISHSLPDGGDLAFSMKAWDLLLEFTDLHSHWTSRLCHTSRCRKVASSYQSSQFMLKHKPISQLPWNHKLWEPKFPLENVSYVSIVLNIWGEGYHVTLWGSDEIRKTHILITKGCNWTFPEDSGFPIKHHDGGTESPCTLYPKVSTKQLQSDTTPLLRAGREWQNSGLPTSAMGHLAHTASLLFFRIEF